MTVKSPPNFVDEMASFLIAFGVSQRELDRRAGVSYTTCKRLVGGFQNSVRGDKYVRLRRAMDDIAAERIAAIYEHQAIYGGVPQPNWNTG